MALNLVACKAIVQRHHVATHRYLVVSTDAIGE